MASLYTTGYASNSGFMVGDSIVSYGWHLPFVRYRADIQNYATGGKGLAGGIAPNIVDSWNTNWPLRKPNTDFVILQGGLNDIKSFGVTIPAMKAAFSPMLAEAIAGVGAERVFVWNIAPWGGASPPVHQQAMTEEWNAWLVTEQAAHGFILIDMYVILGDPSTPANILPAYDVGDGYHPSPAGVLAQYEAMDAAFTAGNILNMVSRMNSNRRWVGAVEPTGRQTLGNELKYWLGAVEPAHVGGVISQGQTIGANYEFSRSNYGLLLLDRALTAAEKQKLYAYLDSRAGVTV